RRLNRVGSLAQQGWKVGLRLDPLIPWPGFRQVYRGFVDRIFQTINGDQVHSITLGPMRFPKAMFDRIVRMYPGDRLFALEEMMNRDGQLTYSPEIEAELLASVEDSLAGYVSSELVFRQLNLDSAFAETSK
ncbi:MAG: DNA photolyase, partial [Verrucomicrobiota bacterium]